METNIIANSPGVKGPPPWNKLISGSNPKENLSWEAKYEQPKFKMTLFISAKFHATNSLRGGIFRVSPPTTTIPTFLWSNGFAGREKEEERGMEREGFPPLIGKERRKGGRGRKEPHFQWRTHLSPTHWAHRTYCVKTENSFRPPVFWVFLLEIVLLAPYFPVPFLGILRCSGFRKFPIQDGRRRLRLLSPASAVAVCGNRWVG